MTRKDYVLIAETLYPIVTYDDEPTVGTDKATAHRIALALANSLQLDNPRFDRDRFLEASGVI